MFRLACLPRQLPQVLLSEHRGQRSAAATLPSGDAGHPDPESDPMTQPVGPVQQRVRCQRQLVPPLPVPQRVAVKATMQRVPRQQVPVR